MKFKTAFKDLYKTLAIQLERQGQDFKEKEVTVEIKEYKKPRTNQQNALMWEMIDKLAKEHRTTSEEIYDKALKDYGVISKEPAGILKNGEHHDRMLKQFEHYVIREGQNPNLDYVYMVFGSSTYDTKEMTVLIDGIISDCKEAGIDVDYYSKEIRSLLKEK